jgi:hypothetical protein
MVAEVDGGNRATGAMTVNQVLDQWLEHCVSVGYSPTVVRKYHEIADRTVRADLGKLRLTKLTARDLDRLYAKLTAKGNAPATVRRVHRAGPDEWSRRYASTGWCRSVQAEANSLGVKSPWAECGRFML